MICSAFFGELCEARKASWNNGDKNPYAVLDSPIRLERKEYALLHEGNAYFHDSIQIDWGSFAWKCTPEEIIKFLIDHKSNLSWLTENDNQLLESIQAYISERGQVPYGVVFIEEG